MEDCVREFIEYVKDFLEKPHPAMNGLPVCPFSHRSRTQGRIAFVVHVFTDENPSPLYPHLEGFASNANLDLLVFIHPDKQGIGYPAMKRVANLLSIEFREKGLVAFAGHPEEDFTVNGIKTRQEPYPNIVVQKASFLAAARETIRKTTYYQGWTKENLEDIGVKL